MFLPVDITKEVGVSQPSTAVTRRAIFEILLRNGRCLKVPIDVELKLLGPLVETVVTEAPSSDAIFGFHGKGADRIKLLWWDGQGLCLFYKILERGYFPWPTAKEGVAHLTQAQLSMLVEGIDWRRPAWTSAPGRTG